MFDFESYEDVEEWLEPLGYDAFWNAIIPTGLYSEADRAHCDHTLAQGIADMETVVKVTKRMALHHLVEQFDLPFRCELPRAPELALME